MVPFQSFWYGFLFVFHSGYGGIFSCFDTLHECDGQTLHDRIGLAYACITLQKLYSTLETVDGLSWCGNIAGTAIAFPNSANYSCSRTVLGV